MTEKENKINNAKEYLRSIFHLHSELDVEAAEATMRKNINFRGMNVFILACAIIIASLGLNINSTAVIIGAMLISPLMGPIIGVGLAIGTNDTSLLKDALRNLGIMVSISLIVSSIYFIFSPLNMQHPSELLARTNPTIYDVLIAFFGGLAGALETSRKEKGTVISGVAIATALMPPLCTVGYGLSILDLKVTLGAFYLFFINCAFVALATFIVVKYLGYPMAKHENEGKRSRAKKVAVVFLLILIVPSVISAVRMVRENNFNTRADNFVAANKDRFDNTIFYNYKTDVHSRPQTLTIFLLGRKLTDTELETMFSCAEKEYGISRHQINFEAALTNAPDEGEFQKEVFSNLNKEIENMKAKLSAYEAKELPIERISAEVRQLYPEITDFDLARGSDAVYAIISVDSSLPVASYELVDSSCVTLEARIERWLKIRLSADSVNVIRR